MFSVNFDIVVTNLHTYWIYTHIIIYVHGLIKYMYARIICIMCYVHLRWNKINLGLVVRKHWEIYNMFLSMLNVVAFTQLYIHICMYIYDLIFYICVHTYIWPHSFVLYSNYYMTGTIRQHIIQPILWSHGSSNLHWSLNWN